MSSYLLASPEEKARLQLQVRVWESESEAMLDRIGVQPGWTCLDLGCGAMGILRLLSRRAGSQGRVVGMDADTSLLNAARAYVEDEGLTNVELREGDAHHTGLPYGTFDLVHERFVFPYVAVEKALGEMIALAKPGGVIATEEPDQYSWNYYPESPQWPRLRQIIEAAFALRGDINVGRRTYALLREAGLEDVTVRAGVLALQNSHPYMRLPIMGINAMRPHILKAGLSSDAELDALLADVERMVSDPQTMQITFTLVQVWGRKPA
jgi:SAM-dependent methyltransferase